MSVTFSVKNTKLPQEMSPKELLTLNVKGLTQYGIPEDHEHYHQMIQNPISEYGYLLMGQENLSGRGFEVSYDTENQDYNIRVFTPSTESDWLGALEFIKALAIDMNSQIVDEQENIYAADKINYAYLHDIEAGINAMKDMENYFIFGVNRPICFSKKMVDDTFAAENSVKHFSKIVEETQYIDAYIANQKFYQKDNQIRGSYTLTQSVETVLPHKCPPFIDFTQVSLKQEDISEWTISLVIIDGNENNPASYKVLGTLDYQTFLEKLPTEKFRKIDGEYMVGSLSRKEMESILKNDNHTTIEENKGGFLSKMKKWFN